MINAKFLLEGAMYALEHCGSQLRNAVMLFNNGGYSDATVLAAFAREELGTCQILLDARKKVVGGQNVTLEEINKECTNHVNKQKWAQLSVVQRAGQDDTLGKLFRARMENHPQSQEWKKADTELSQITKKQKKRTPDDRHNLRINCLYVQLTEAGTTWNRPSQHSKESAEMFLYDAVNDYRVQYDKFQRGTIEYTDLELSEALQAWPERPTLPDPQSPNSSVPHPGATAGVNTMPQIEISQEMYERLLAFKPLVDAITGEESTLQDHVEHLLFQALRRLLAEAVTYPDPDNLLSTIQAIADQHPKEVYSFVTKVWQKIGEQEAEKLKEMQKRFGFNQ